MEQKSILKKPPRYVLASILISFGASIFGMDTGMIGPITTMPQFIDTFGTDGISATVHGVIVSSILIPAATSSLFAGHLADSVGRVRGVAIGELIFGIGAAIEAGSVKSLGMLIVGRCVAGIGEGLFLSTLYTYICEISPPRVRGSLASTPQILVTAGLMFGYFACYGSVHISSTLSWRLPFGIQSFLSISFSILTLSFLEESPRWLSAKGRKEEALRAWERLDVLVEEREKDSKDDETIVRIGGVRETGVRDDRVDVDLEEAEPVASGPVVKVKVDAFLRVFQKGARKRTALGCFLGSMQQFGGIDGVLFYAPLLFRQAGVTSSSSTLLVSCISAILIFLTTIPALILADRWNRRTCILTGGIGGLICMSTIGSLYASNSVHGDGGAGRWIVIIMIFLFATVFSLTWGVIIKTYASEIQPPATRAAATSLSQSMNWISNFIVALTTPILLAHSSYGAYIFFGACNALTVLVCLLFMPETRGKTLEDIDASFKR